MTMDDPTFRPGDRLEMSLRGKPVQSVRVASVFPAGVLLVAEDGTAELVSHQRLEADLAGPQTDHPRSDPASEPSG